MLNVSSLVALVVLSAGSCDPARFAQPLSDPRSAKVDTAITGLWTGSDSDKRPIYVHVIGLLGGEMEFVLVGYDDNETTVFDYRGIATESNGVKLLSLHSKTADKLSKDWIVAKYELGKDDSLLLSFLSNEAAGKAISAKRLKGSLAKTGEAHVSDTAAHVLAFVSSADAVWSPLPPVKRLAAP